LGPFYDDWVRGQLDWKTLAATFLIHLYFLILRFEE
jgi:hypothetical protein